MQSFGSEIGLAVRALRKHPGFGLTTTLTLAIAIGATTAIFSVVYGVLLRPLPYNQPDQLVLVWGDMRTRNVRDFPLSPPDFQDLKRGVPALQDLAAILPQRQTLANDGAPPEQVRVAGVTANLLELLGARVVLGRGFVAEDAVPEPPSLTGSQQPAPPQLPGIVVLSHDFWQRRFGGDPSVIGRTLNIGPFRAQVAGVLAPDFELLFPPSANVYPVPDLFVALRIDFDKADRQFAFLRVIGRMKPGVSAEMVSVQAEQVATDLRERFPIKKAADLHFYVVPMHQDLVAHVRPTINALMGAAFFVLLIACANVANLLLVRAMARKREVAIRAALGSSPARLVSHMLGESIVLAACGALLGLVLAWAGIKLLIAFAPANLPRLNDVRIDPVVLGFFFLAGVLTLALFGALPAIRASRPNIAGLLRAGGQTPGLHDGRKLRNIVVVTEVALSLVLLVGCGLMVRSFVALQQVDPGYAPSGVLTFQAPNAFAQTSEVSSAYARRLQERLSALPGVKAVTAARPFPLDGRVSSVRWGTAAAAENPSKFQQANVHFVLPGYFEAMHTRLIAGRTFTQDDNRDSAMVVVVDRLLAAKAFPGESAVGKRLLVRFRAPEPEWLEVIGVVEHQRHESLAKEGRETLFLTDGFFGHGTVDTWAVRTIGNPSDLVPAVRAAVAEVEPRVAVFDVQPMQSLVDHAMAPMRFALVLISVFAAVAVLLAAVGLYGVLSTSVRQRTAEIGLRIAIGAPAHSILGLIIGEGVKLSVAGIVLGLGAAFVLTRLIRSLLYGIAPTDPATFAVVVLLFLWIAVLASWLPARRAARLPPTTALRDE